MPMEYKCFPKDKQEAVTFLYMQQQDLTGKSPEELVEMYDAAFKRINDRFLTINGKEPYFNRGNS